MSQLLFFMETKSSLPAILFFVLVNFCGRFIVDRRTVAVNNPSPSFVFSSYSESMADCKKSMSIFNVSRSMVFNTRTAENNSGLYFASHRILKK